ncbi:MAG: restriction endonuclease subunit S, partial [Candidatus Promineifilaceae bacterium]
MSELEMLFERFDGLIQTAADVRKLEQAILQWAVMGRLVPQDPTDEPASVLLKRIAAEKARLVKEKKIRKGKKLAAISAEEIPFKVPANWSWVRFDELINFLNGYAFKSRWYVQASHNQVIRLGNVKNSGLKLEANPAYIPQEQAIQHEKYRLKINDILITMTGTRGKRDYGFTSLIKAVDTSEYRLYLNQRVGCIRTIGELRPRLTSIFLKSEYFISQLLQDETGT